MRLDTAECRTRFAAARVARLATVTVRGRPHLVPISFAIDGDELVFAVDQKPKATTSLRRLEHIAANPAVSMLADHYADDDWTELWWVRADGRAVVLADRDPHRTVAVARLVARYAQYRADPPRGPVVAITVDRWTGWAAADA